MGSSGGAKPGGQAKGGNSKGAGGKNNAFSSGTGGYKGGGNFWDFQARPVAGLNQFQQGAGAAASRLGGAGARNYGQAQNYLNQLGGGGSGFLNQGISQANRFANQLPGQFQEAQGLSRDLVGLGKKQVTGANIQSDPAYKASQQAFSQSQLPLIQNQAALAGLGRSSAMTNAVAHGNAQAMLPMIQDALAREERGIGREISTTGQAAQNLFNIGGQRLAQNAQGTDAYFRGAGQEASNLANAAQGSAGLGGQQFSNQANQANLLSNLGQQYRGVEQQQLDAPYQEQQRLWREALNAQYGPLSFLGNMGGATSTQSKK